MQIRIPLNSFHYQDTIQPNLLIKYFLCKANKKINSESVKNYWHYIKLTLKLKNI